MAASTVQNNIRDSEKLFFRLVWLDKNMKNHGNRVRIKLFKEIDADIETFDSEEDCIDSIQRRDKSKLNIHVIFIISGALSEIVIPQIQNYRCICAIFIFCTHAANYEHLKYQKLRAIHIDPYELMDDIEMSITKFNERTSFSLFSDQQQSGTKSSDQQSIRNLKEDLASFLWFRQMNDFMLTLEYHNEEAKKQAKQEAVSICRQESPDKSKLQSKIDEFQNQTLTENEEEAIRWYSDNSFMHRCTNTVLRKENVGQVYSLRYIIKLICQQLKILHENFIHRCKRRRKKTLQVYRGQYLEPEQIKLLKSHRDHLISLNGFVSTSKDREIAIEFIQNWQHEGFQPVLFEIDLDLTSMDTVPFADVSALSKYRVEQEVLFSIGSIFFVQSVEWDEELQFYVIRLTLARNDQITVTQYIQETYAKNLDSADQSVLFGKLLFDMGATEAAVKYFSDALINLSGSNNQLRPIFLNNLGVCYNELRKRDQALEYYKRAMAVYQDRNDQRGLGACRHNIASIYLVKKEPDRAQQWALQALECRRDPGIERASTFDLLGSICLASSPPDCEAALGHFEEALKIRQKYLYKINPNHPDIGVSHHHLGTVKSRMVRLPSAKNHFSKAAEIYRHNYALTHPLVDEITKCLKRIQ